MVRLPPNSTQPIPKDHQNHNDKTKWQWAICNLVALRSGSGPGFSSFMQWVDDLHSQAPDAFCNLSRDKLYACLGFRIRGLRSADIDNQVEKLQDDVKTHTGKPFTKAACEGRLDNLESIDYLTWLHGVSGSDIVWGDLYSDNYDLYLAILLGLVLARLGKVVGTGAKITDVIPSTIEQYRSGEGLLPDPNAPRCISPASRQLPPRPASSRPAPQHTQLYFGHLLVWATVIVLLLLLLVMNTLIVLQLASPEVLSLR
ncbi:hypothetical protein EDB81DRAFT_18924 [Dactylonectria macrodidyma]|uniref:Uncharacterized protein n=1 Tax=Dactylonectria macrodidyma TaxID=307937 RepID=A0A9P9FUT4_9HYPO|nr:hypothetical protein EDB81DRAFT_18924 [Dactylonectria macrodidyma]